jgi:hypothetical protein
MTISMICCPFQTSYGAYASALRAAIENVSGNKIQWVASRCGCGDPIEVGRIFQTKDCIYFDMPMLSEYQSTRKWRRWARNLARSVLVDIRARRYAKLSKDADLVHFHQILNAYGSKAVFHWLNLPSAATRIVTVHELDADQLDCPARNQDYNRADGIIVHCQEMKDHLTHLNVQPEKIHITLHGTCMPPLLDDKERDGVVFYGGHKIMSGKGIDTLFAAFSIVQRQMASHTPVLKIHGYYGTVTPAAAIQLARDAGVTDRVVWLNPSGCGGDRAVPAFHVVCSAIYRRFCRSSRVTSKRMCPACHWHSQGWPA